MSYLIGFTFTLIVLGTALLTKDVFKGNSIELTLVDMLLLTYVASNFLSMLKNWWKHY